MQILIDKETRVSSDRHSYRVERCTGVNHQTGRTVWKAVSHHTSIESLARALFELPLRQSNAQTFSELLEIAKRIETTITEALSSERTVVS